MRLIAAFFTVFLLSVTEAAANYTCTLVMGFSQTGQWYQSTLPGSSESNFENLVDNSAWQLVRRDGGSIQRWINPNDVGWEHVGGTSTRAPLRSPCALNRRNPERIVFNVSGASRTPAEWAQAILDAMTTTVQKYPMTQKIYLQPVVGGPNHTLCFKHGQVVRASKNHPVIDEGIAIAIQRKISEGLLPGHELLAGFSPEVQSCDNYSDRLGHLRQNVIFPGENIAIFFLALDGEDSGGGEPDNTPTPSGDPGGGNSGDNNPETVSLVVKVEKGRGTVTSKPPGINCSQGTCSASFAKDSKVTLTARPSSNRTFKEWKGKACRAAGIGPCTLTVNSLTTVEARFR